MRSLFFLSASAALVCAFPKPQDIDFAAPVPHARLAGRDACDPEPTLANIYHLDVRTAKAFLKDHKIFELAWSAHTPDGYKKTFTNLHGATEGSGYLGYTVIPKYKPHLCAEKCNDMEGCLSFNLFIERDPAFTPGDACPNPKAFPNIKCSFWGGPVDASTATNVGQWRYQFQVVNAGSNGYTTNKYHTVKGYTGPTYLGDASINAPSDCNGVDTYMGYNMFTSGPFDPRRCAAACDAASGYNLAHPPTDGSAPRLCSFFNTYIMLKDGKSQGQMCAMYTEPWNATYATNRGQTRSDGVYTASYSFSYYNTSNPGYPTCTTSVPPETSAF